ncbi:golgin candidate 2 [Forsythia ovata]|uniref:Golgin candidate 2 n=1 Tax=Forsythia ovata TaxID=205694 RepID=A0ABD1R1M6_9LAMI
MCKLNTPIHLKKKSKATTTTWISELQSDGGESVQKDTSDALVPDNKNEANTGKYEEVNGIGDGEKLRSTDGLTNEDHTIEMVPASLHKKLDMEFKSGMIKNNKSKVGSRSSSSMKKGSSSPSVGESDSETDSTSS